METIQKGKQTNKQTNKQTSRGSMCGGMDAGGSAELCSMWSPVHNTSEYMEELWRCIRDASEKHRVQYTGSYSDTCLIFLFSVSTLLVHTLLTNNDWISTSVTLSDY